MNFKKKISGSWTDTPHYIHNTSTDTITTLPADIYANDTTATVGLKGNTAQSGTPTPDNPIMPQGCGDLETTGEHTGQYKIPISSANTTTPVYLGEVESTRKIKKLVLDGTESVSKDTGQDPTLYFLRYKHIQINSYCTHLRSVSTKPQSGEFSTVAQYDGYIFMNFGADIMNAQQSGNTIEGFKEYLAAQYAAGTPVTVWYVLATEETGIVNEPLMKIGEYVDTVSGISIPVTTGGDSVDIETTVKPSEVSLTYTGWHDAQCKEYDGSQWV